MGSRHLHLHAATRSTSRAFSYNRIDAQPAVTSGLQNEDYGINVPNTNPLAPGPGLDRDHRVLQPRRRAAAVRQARQRGVPVHRRLHLDARQRTRMKFGVDVRTRAHGHRVHQPPERRLHVHRPACAPATPPRTSCSACPAQFRRTTTNQAQDGVGWLYSGYAQDEWRAASHLTLNAGRALRAVAAVRRQERRAQRVPPGRAVDAVPRRAGGPGLSRAIPACRAAPTRPTRTTSRRASASSGIRPATAGPRVRAAWGIFYDALAGQGDFFQNGVLAPPFTPLVEVNAPPAPITLAQSAERRSPAAPTLFPPALTIIGWGEDFQTPYAYHFNATVQRRSASNIGAEVGYVGSRGTQHADLHGGEPGRLRAGADDAGRAAVPGVRAGAADLLGRGVEVRLAPGEPADAADARRQLPGVLHARHAKDHVSGLNIGGEPRPVLPVTIGDEASFERALAFEMGPRAVRRPPPLRRQLRRRAADAARAWARCVEHVARRLAAERHRPDADRLPADGDRRAARHPLS